LRAGLDDVALIIDTDVDCLAILFRAAAPYSLIVLLQMRDLASPSVKLLRPATGAVTWRFDESELLIGLFCGPSLAGGFWFCATAPVATKASIAAIASGLRMGSSILK
jgi:hypothetical protein